MQTLGVVPRLFPDILAGRKTSTIRWSEAEIVPGPMIYVCDGEPQRRVVVMVTRVTAMPLSEAAAYLRRAEEWPPAVMLDGMREHYPGIGLEDTVSVIEHMTPAETAAIGIGEEGTEGGG